MYKYVLGQTNDIINRNKTLATELFIDKNTIKYIPSYHKSSVKRKNQDLTVQSVDKNKRTRQDFILKICSTKEETRKHGLTVKTVDKIKESDNIPGERTGLATMSSRVTANCLPPLESENTIDSEWLRISRLYSKLEITFY